MIPPIIAPVRWRTTDDKDCWIGISFTPGQGSNEPITRSSNVIFTASAYREHLNRLKNNLGILLADFNIPFPKQQQVASACPSVDLFRPVPSNLLLPVKLAVEEQRSWELAYLLSCMASADLGIWEHISYWATGQVSGEWEVDVGVDTLDEKVDFVFNQDIGRVHFFLPTEDSYEDRPPDVTLTNVTKLNHLFIDPRSPLSRQSIDPLRFSNLGIPTSLLDFLYPETFDTRVGTKDDLLKILKDQAKRLVLVSSPIGWGKTTLLANALYEHRGPVYVSDFKNVRNSLEAADCLLKGIAITEDEAADIETDINHVATKLNSRLPSNTLLVFVNTSLNSEQTPSPAVQEMIWLLLRNNFRCIVELWDLESWQQREYLTHTQEIIQADIPPLNQDEVRNWLARYELDDQEVFDAFSLFDGHPMVIRMTISRLLRDRRFGFPIDYAQILDAAISWLEHEQNVSSYLERIESNFNQDLPPSIIEWFALFWDQALPKNLIESPEYERQLKFGVRIGLLTLTPENSGYKAYGWFNLFCIEKLKQTGLRGDHLTVNWSQLESISAREYLRLKRHLMEMAAYVPQAKKEIKRLAMEVPEPIVRIFEPINEYVAPNTTETLAAIIPESSNPAETIWALEQSSRLNLFKEAQEYWEKLLDIEQRDSLLSKLEEDWLSLKSLSQAYRISSRRIAVPLSITLQLLDILKALNISQAGHRSYAAYICLDIANDLSASGYKNEAHEATTLAANLLNMIPEPPPTDNRYGTWLELRFRLCRTQYLISSFSAEAKNRLNEVTDIIERGINYDSHSYLWQNRYFRYVSEAVELADEEHKVNVNPTILGNLFNTDPSELLEEFLTARLDIFSSTRKETLNELDIILINLTKTKWREGESLKSEPQTRQEFFSLQCGLLLMNLRAIKATQKIIERVWTTSSDEDNLFADEYLRLTTLCLRLITGKVTPQNRPLFDAIHAIKRPRIKELSKGVAESILRQFWIAYLSYRVSSYRARFHDINSQMAHSNITGTNALLQVQHLERDMDTLFDQALREQPKDAARILALKYDFHIDTWQEELNIRRNSKGRRDEFRSLFPSKNKSVIEEMENLCPNDPLTWRCKAFYFRYIWQLKDACQAAERAYLSSRYARSRRQTLWFLAKMLITWIYTPDILQTNRTAPADLEAISKLNSITPELISLWPERIELLVFRDGIEGDATFWQKVIDEVEKRLGTPEEFWERVANTAFIEEPKDHVEDALSDLTDTEILKMISKVLKWASQRDDFDESLRLRLAETSIICIYAAQNWRHGNFGRYSISEDYSLATAIILALKETKDGFVMGRELSPIPNKRGNRFFTWGEAADVKLRNVRAMGTGAFKEHADELWKKFKSYYQ